MFLIIEDNYQNINIFLSNRFEYKGIEIFKKDDDYLMRLTEKYVFKDNINEIVLEEKRYEIVNRYNFEKLIFFVYKDKQGINDYNLYENKEFIIANHNKANIRCTNKYASDYYLLYQNGYLKSNYENLSYNSHKYNNEIIKENDYIDYFGIHIIFKKDFLYINNFNIINKLEIKRIDEKLITLTSQIPKINNYYEQYLSNIEIKPLRKIDLPRKINTRNLVFQIGPSLTMSFGMLFIAIMNYRNNLSGNYNWAAMIMPLIMIVSSTLWPTLINKTENYKYKKQYQNIKNKYIDYLEKYEKDIIKQIDNYIKNENKFAFNTKSIEDKLFCISFNSPYFLNITIGKYLKSFSFNYEESIDEDINEIMDRIKYRLNNIEDCPLTLNIKENRSISIITSESLKYYHLKRVILEICYKYHFDDVCLYIYTHNKKLIYEINNLPQLFNQSKRNTLLDEYDVIALNKQNITKPTILIIDEDDINITNKDISVILFSSKSNMILKNSDVIIKYEKDKGIYSTKEKNYEFVYQYEDIDFDNYFKYISRHTKYELVNKSRSFKDINNDINIIESYKEKQESLQAIFAISNNKPFMFDLHEKKDGPHGLIGGSTGSGKSELLVSMLLSLCIKYRPDYLNIILIDYKGGGIEESLSYKKNRIPHIIASISNLETDTFERLIVAISRECQKRQKLFKELSSKCMSSIMNIDDYLENYENYNLPKIAHLLIVVDEFAELKKENPEIIKELISFSRIGRSLGLHLLLATQKPSGVIDEEIWSNSHFKLALKVHNEKDSIDIIKTKDSAYLKDPGEFIMRVDDKLTRCQSIYSKNDINNINSKSVYLLNNKLEIHKQKIVKKENPFMESSYLVSKILEAKEILAIEQNTFVFEKPHCLSINAIEQKYHIKNKFILGEVDDYLNAEIKCLSYDIDDNLMIVTSRKNEINNILIQLDKNNVNTIVISNNKYSSKNIIGNINYENDCDIKYVFNKLLKDNENRICLVVEDYSALISYNEDYANLIYKLLRRTAINRQNVILISLQSNINFKLVNIFKNKLLIDMVDEQDYLNIFYYKSIYKGKSYCSLDEPITFVPCEICQRGDGVISDVDYLDHIPQTICYKKDEDKILIGYDVINRNELYINKKENLLISAFDDNDLSFFKKIFINECNVDVVQYSLEIPKDKYDAYLWIGPGINRQRLFFVDRLEETKSYLYRNCKGKEIEVINHE